MSEKKENRNKKKEIVTLTNFKCHIYTIYTTPFTPHLYSSWNMMERQNVLVDLCLHINPHSSDRQTNIILHTQLNSKASKMVSALVSAAIQKDPLPWLTTCHDKLKTELTQEAAAKCLPIFSDSFDRCKDYSLVAGKPL